MRGFASLLPRLLAAILLLQAVAAPARCLAAAAPAGFATVICTAEGPRSLHLDAGGSEAPAPGHDAAFCTACHALPQAPPLTAPVPPPQRWVATPPAWLPSTAEHLPRRARAPPFDPTGPPGIA